MTPPPRTLAEQLAPVAARLRQGQALVRPVSQVLVRLSVEGDSDLFNRTVDHVLRWMNNRAGGRLPREAWQRQSFELDAVGAQRTSAVSLNQPPFWAARLDDADKLVPQRTWVTEIGIGADDSAGVVFGARLTCATRGEDVPFDRTVPGFVRGVVGSAAAWLDGVPMSIDAEPVIDDQGVDRLVDLLESPARRHPVIVLALPDGSLDLTQAAIDIGVVRQRTLGAAHVRVITGPASYHLSDLLGKELSVFRQAVRLYRPGFTRWRSNPYDHPLAVPARIASWNDEGPHAYASWLVSQALAVTAHAADREDLLPSFDMVRRMAAQAQRKAVRDSGGSDAQLLKLADDEIRKLEASLSEQKQTYDGLLLDLQRQLDDAQEARRETLAEQFVLRERIERMQAALSSSATATPIPDRLDEFEAWCGAHLAGRVTLASRAYRGVKQSVYEDARLLYEALLLLRDFYVPMKREPSLENKARFEAECQRLKIENALVGEATRTHASDYTVRHCGRPRILDWHLKRGDGRERARCFRLYYFWDDETQCAVVGWLPSHLDNALT